MLRFLFAGLLIVAIAVSAYVGCGARAQVAGDKILAKIDDMLGSLDVKLKEIKNAHADLKASAEHNYVARKKSEYKVEELEEKQKEVEAKIAKKSAELKKAIGVLEDGSLADDVEKKAKATNFAEERVKSLTALKGQLANSIKPLLASHKKALTLQIKHGKASKAQLEKLETKISQIEAEKVRLDTMKQAQAIAGSSESISDQFAELEQSTADLLIEVKARADIEEEKVDDRLASIDEDISLEELLGEESQASDEDKLQKFKDALK